MAELRPARVQDVPALLGVCFAALDDLAERRGRTLPRPQPGALEEIIRHLLATDPASALVAEEDGDVVAFGMLHVRGASAFLAFLFVLPDRQSRGLGRALLEECLASVGRPGRVGVCVDADQPVATGLYASLGLVPRVPLHVLRGRPRAAELPDLPEGCRMRQLHEPSVGAIDERLLAYRRPADHAFWRASGRQGWQLEERSGRVVGYGYAQASGRIGPVAADEPRHLPAILGHLAREVEVADGWQVIVPGPCAPAWGALLGCGLRVDGPPGLYGADHAGPAFERYLPMSYALL